MRTISELYSQCFEWFLNDFAAGSHGSLQVLADPDDDDPSAIKIQSRDDGEMKQNAKLNIVKLKASRFVAFGEGNIMYEGKPLPVFIMYRQERGDDTVQMAVMPYSVGEDGRLELTKWHQMRPLADSWLPPMPTDS